MKELDFKTTKDLKVPKRLVEQVVGQDKSIEIIRKAAARKVVIRKSLERMIMKTKEGNVEQKKTSCK